VSSTSSVGIVDGACSAFLHSYVTSCLQIRALHPKYTVGLTCNEYGTPAVVKAKYQDGTAVTIDAQGKSFAELVNALLEATEPMKDKEDMVELEKN
jgi:hypothetical protein